MSTPIAVVISDIHFSLSTLDIATKALTAAIVEAEYRELPLIIAGDLTNDKAIIRAEVANTLMSILKFARCKVIILVGNHDKINEKSLDHSLRFLERYAEVIDSPVDMGDYYIIPYLSDTDNLKLPPNKLLIMHQGFAGAAMGDYIIDKTSISTEIVKDHIVISGHYHKHQTVGTVMYLGSPYTITFGEAHDGDKGYIILNKDGTFERKILNLRKHLIVERTIENLTDPVPNYNPGDLVWLKVTGPQTELDLINKNDLGNLLFTHSNYKLDKIVNCLETIPHQSGTVISDSEVLDSLIDKTSEDEETKHELKCLWRELLNE